MTKRERDELRREALATLTAASARRDALLEELAAVRAVCREASKVLRKLGA